MPWALHEPRPGRYAWSGHADVCAFLHLAHSLNLTVVLRPGPFIGAHAVRATPDEPNVVLQRRSHQLLLCWLVKLPEQWLVNRRYGSMLVGCVARAQLRSLTLADSPHGWPTLRSALPCLLPFCRRHSPCHPR